MRVEDRVIYGELWESPADLVVVTTNGVLTSKQGLRLVMGRGAAWQAKLRYKDFDLEAADHILERHLYRKGRCYIYGFLPVPTKHKERPVIGIFQVKYDWQELASRALIGYSVIRLNLWLQQFYPADEYPEYQVAMNFPGIGNGHLPYDEVRSIVEDLDPRVSFYRAAQEHKHGFSLSTEKVQ